LRRFVFVNARKFDLKTLLAERLDFKFTAFPLPGAVDLSGSDTLFAASLYRNNAGSGQAERADDDNFSCLSHDAVTKDQNTRKSFSESRKLKPEDGEEQGT